MNQEEFQHIESPSALFNNFMLSICDRLSEIYDGYDFVKNNAIIFDNESIILFGYIKITRDCSNRIKIDIKKSINFLELKFVKQTLNNFNNLNSVFYSYLFLLNDISKNYDTTVSINYVNSILHDIVLNNFEQKLYFIPFRHKIANEIKDNETLNNLYNKFSYGLKITKIPNKYKFAIIRLISSDLNESKCIANIRPLEIDKIIDGYIENSEIESFLKKLMLYGQIDNIKSITL